MENTSEKTEDLCHNNTIHSIDTIIKEIDDITEDTIHSIDAIIKKIGDITRKRLHSVDQVYWYSFYLGA